MLSADLTGARASCRVTQTLTPKGGKRQSVSGHASDPPPPGRRRVGDRASNGDGSARVSVRIGLEVRADLNLVSERSISAAQNARSKPSTGVTSGFRPLSFSGKRTAPVSSQLAPTLILQPTVPSSARTLPGSTKSKTLSAQGKEDQRTLSRRLALSNKVRPMTFSRQSNGGRRGNVRAEACSRTRQRGRRDESGGSLGISIFAELPAAAEDVADVEVWRNSPEGERANSH